MNLFWEMTWLPSFTTIIFSLHKALYTLLHKTGPSTDIDNSIWSHWHPQEENMVISVPLEFPKNPGWDWLSVLEDGSTLPSYAVDLSEFSSNLLYRWNRNSVDQSYNPEFTLIKAAVWVNFVLYELFHSCVFTSELLCFTGSKHLIARSNLSFQLYVKKSTFRCLIFTMRKVCPIRFNLEIFYWFFIE